MYLQNNPWHTGSDINTSFYTRSGLWSAAVERLQRSIGRQWHSQTWLESMCGLSPVMMCVLFDHTGPRSLLTGLVFSPPPLSFLWGNNEQHTRIRNSSLIHTCTVAHPHALFYNTRWEKERRETSLTKCTAVCTGEKLCARMITLQQEKCYITMLHLFSSIDEATFINSFYINSHLGKKGEEFKDFVYIYFFLHSFPSSWQPMVILI